MLANGAGTGMLLIAMNGIIIQGDQLMERSALSAEGGIVRYMGSVLFQPEKEYLPIGQIIPADFTEFES